MPGLLSALLALCVSGCHRPSAPEGVTAAPVADDDVEPLWDAALSVLRKHDFQPDRQDRAMGTIETLPTTSQNLGEFWRQDVADFYGLVHASLHTTQRKATVHFVHGKDGWTIEVQVDVYRLSMPESQITTASSAIQSFSGALPTTEGQVFQDPRSQHRWVHLGRDADMESRLLDSILCRGAW